MPTPKVSVIIPCYNVEKYLRECLDSIVNQTLREIQIICVNDGSTDSTPAILEEYASGDDRIQIITKTNSGYGDSMNRGMDLAEGEYLGIVESDDFIELDMYERLYHAAVEQDLDVAKAGFYLYSTTPQVQNVPRHTLADIAGQKVFCPMCDFANPIKQGAFFKEMSSIWAAIYRRDFIRQNNIRFNPTPGASYQDVGFCLKVWSRAKRVRVLDACLLHYRVDNSNSSIHNPGKVFCLCDEYAELERYLGECPEQKAAAMPVMLRSKYENYLWNYERLSESLRKDFLLRFHEEFTRHHAEGTLCRAYFLWYDWDHLQTLLLDPVRFHEIQSARLQGNAAPDFYDAYPEYRPIKSKYLYVFAKKAAGMMKYLMDEGVSGTAKVISEKVSQKIAK